jgi:Holliday junction resolvasome RuvABC endonuclease subunit
VKLLAIDPGSLAIGFAYFIDGDLRQTDLIRPKSTLSWLERMGYIADQLGRGALARAWSPDVVAIEKVAAHRNVSTALTMSMTIGYVARVIDELYPRCQWIEMSKAATCHVIGLKGNARREERQRAAAEHFPQLASQDEADAAVVGIAALEEIGGEKAAVS